MIGLLDVNVLVSLAWPNHVHHDAAHRWFGHHQGGWATTPVTESGFVRVSSNRAAVPTAVPPAEALALLTRVCAVPGHVFLVDDVQLIAGDDGLDQARVVTHRLVTDAHLLAVARRHGARLVTFDRGAAALAQTRSDVVVLRR